MASYANTFLSGVYAESGLGARLDLSWIHVQGTGAQTAVYTNHTLTATFSGAVAAGDMIVVSVAWFAGSTVTPTVSDNVNNVNYTYRGPTIVFSALNLGTWTYVTPLGAASSSFAVTFSSDTGNYLSMAIDEFTYGIVKAAYVVDSSGTKVQSGATSISLASPLAITGQDLIYAAAACNGSGTITSGSGFTLSYNAAIKGGLSYGIVSEYRFPIASSITPSISSSGAVLGNFNAIAFKASPILSLSTGAYSELNYSSRLLESKSRRLLENGSYLLDENSGSVLVHAKSMVCATGSYAESGVSIASTRVGNLISSSGSYSESSVSAATHRGSIMVGSESVYSASGFSVTSALRHYLVGAKGSYSESGVVSTLESARNLPATKGSYSESSSGVFLSRVLLVSAGAYSESGKSAVPLLAHLPDLGTIQYALAFNDTGEIGFPATIKSARHLIGATGSYAESGVAAVVKSLRHLFDGTGVYSESSSGLIQVRSRFQASSVASYLESGADSFLVHGYPSTASKGSYSESGVGLSYVYSQFFACATVHYAESGQSGALVQAHGSIHYSVVGLSGSYAMSGTSSEVQSLRHFLASPASYVESVGTAATLSHGRFVVEAEGSYSGSARQASLISTHSGIYAISANGGHYACSGSNIAQLHSSYAVGATGLYKELTSAFYQNAFLTGSYSSSGKQATIRLGPVTSCAVGTYHETSPGLRHAYGYKLAAQKIIYPNPNIVAVATGVYSESGSATVIFKSNNLIGAVGSYSESGVSAATGNSLNLFGSSGLYSEAAESHRSLESLSNRLLENNFYRILETPYLSANLVQGHPLVVAKGQYFTAGFLEYLLHSSPSTFATGVYSESGKSTFYQLIHHLIAAAGAYSESSPSATINSFRNLFGGKGSYAETGNTASALRTVSLLASQGVYLESGKPASVVHGLPLAALSGAYAESGVNLSQLHTIQISVGLAHYSETGNPATFVSTHQGIYANLLSGGVYGSTGFPVSINSTRHLIASSGAYSESGKSSSLARSYLTSEALGSYVESGNPLVQVLSHRLVGSSGQYVASGSGLSSFFRHSLVSSEAIYSEAGQSTTLKAFRHLPSALASYSESGFVESTTSQRHLVSAAGQYSESGSVLVQARVLRATFGVGSYSETGSDCVLVSGHIPIASLGSYVFHGTSASLVHSHALAVNAGVYSLAGGFATTIFTAPYIGNQYALSVASGSYLESGSSASYRGLRHLFTAIGNYVEIGYVSSITHGYRSSLSTGSSVEIGKPSVSAHSYFLSGVRKAYLETGFDAALLKSRSIIASASSSIVVHPGVAGGFDRTGLAASAITVSAASNATVVPPPPTTPTTVSGSRVRLVPKAWSIIARDAYTELGRFRHGDKVTMSISLPGVPDSAPIAVIFAEGTNQLMGVYQLPSIDSTNLNFALPMQMGNSFSFGTYLVTYQFTIGGVQGTVDSGRFQVIPGGNPAGDVIFMHAIDRPEATFVLTQTSDGRLYVGRNPSIA